MISSTNRPSFLKVVNEDYSTCIPKNTSRNFARRLLRFRTVWCTFTRFNPLLWTFRWFQIIVVDSCFIHCHESTQKLIRIAVTIGKILLWSNHTNAFAVDCEQSQHPSCTELSHAQMCMKNIDHTFSWDGYNPSYLTQFYLRVIQNNIMDFIDHFWCSDLIWTTWTWYGFCARTTTTRFGNPLLNDSIRRSRIRIILIELGLGFWLSFSSQKVVFNQHTKFTLFHFCKKFEGWLFSDTATCKLINRLGSNFDRRGLQGGTCQQW